MIKITVLNDNRNDTKTLKSEHGLSLYIEADNKKILMDAGQTDIYKYNAKKLNIDLNKIDYIILSHGDYDHGNGLKYFDNKVTLICHPNCCCYRVSKRTGKFDGLNQSEAELNKKFNLIKSTNPYYITDNIIFLGQILKTNNFEVGSLPMIDENNNDYEHLDDSGIVINTSLGLIVISGCAHSGICNTIEYAKKITGNNDILAVMGGFHLKEIDNRTLQTIKYMKENNVKNIYLAHCTSDIVCNKFLNELPSNVKIVKTGKTYIF